MGGPVDLVGGIGSLEYGTSSRHFAKLKWI
jgi:hypothetical protein